MNYKLDKSEQYALINVQEESFNGDVAGEFELVARDLFREGYHNLVVNLSTTRGLDTGGISVLKKINMLCTRELGLMVLVSEDDDFVDKLIDARIRDVTILPTVEEAIDAVFMNDLENEFGASSGDDFNADELDEEGFTKEGGA
jgi:anti-anti-sigma regulatory factor